MKKRLGRRVFCCLILLSFLCVTENIYIPKAEAKTIVEKRLAEVKKYYPGGSRINSYVSDGEGFSGGGCNALVMFTTMRIFHAPFVPYSKAYKRIGKAASTKRPGKMRKLFKKAKVGDAIQWSKAYKDTHFAIFLSSNSRGVYLYEANFHSRNLVWDKHFWAWKNMRTWPAGGADKVSVWRFKKYNQVNRKKCACNFKKGKTFTVSGICYKVIQSGQVQGKVKVVGYKDSASKKKIPKYLYLRLTEKKEIDSYEKGYHSFSKNKNANAQVTYQVVK